MCWRCSIPTKARRSCVVLLLLLCLPVVVTPLSAAVLDLQIVDEGGSPLPARVLLRPHGAECVVPEGAVELRVGPDRWFMTPGDSEVDVPVGRVQIRVEHGVEYVRYKQDVEISGPRTTKRIA